MKKTGKKFKRTGFVINPMFNLTKEEHLLIINPTHVSLIKFRESVATATDWYNVAFRTYCGSALAKIAGYSDETIDELLRVHKMLLNIEEQSRETGHKDWILTTEELEELQAAIEATDELQYATTRVANYKATIIARDYMKKFL